MGDIKHLSADLLNSDWLTRYKAVTALGNSGDPQAVPPLLAALANQSFWARRRTMSFLVKLAAATGNLKPFVKALEHKDYHVRKGAAKVLDKQGWNPANQNERANYLTAKKKWKALSEMGSDAVPALLNILADEKILVRNAAAKTLGKIGDPTAVEPLISGLCGKYAVRLSYGNAKQALVRIKTAASIAPFIKVLKHRDPFVRWAAADVMPDLDWEPSDDTEKALALIAREEWDQLPPLGRAAVGPLTHVLSDNCVNIRNGAVEALGKINDAAVIPSLITALRDPSPRVKQTAAQALGKIRDDIAVKPLMAALKDKNAVVREQAVEALSNFTTGPQAYLIDALKNEPAIVRENAAKLLGNIGHISALEPLSTVFTDDSAVKPRAAAALALGKLADPGALPLLIPALEDERAEFRENAAEALGLIGDDRAVEPLTAGKDDLHPQVRAAVIRALGRIADPGTLDYMLAALKDKYIAVRVAAVEAIGNSGNSRAMTPLLKASLKNTSSELWRQTVNRAFKKLRSRMFFEAVDYTCETCLLRYRPHTDSFMKLHSLWHPTVTYWTCPECFDDTRHLVDVQTVAILLDRNVKETRLRDGSTLLVNWFERNELFDYTEIRIVDADDFDVENLLVKLSNDMNDARRRRLPKIPVRLAPNLQLSPAKMNMLKDSLTVKISDR